MSEEYNWWLWHEVRMRVLDRDKRCAYCDVELDDKSMTIDHVIPKGKGGDPASLSNMVAACKECNFEKKDMLPLDYIVYRLKYNLEGAGERDVSNSGS